MDSKDPKMSKRLTVDNQKHITLTFPKNLEIIWRLEESENCLHELIICCIWYKEMENILKHVWHQMSVWKEFSCDSLKYCTWPVSCISGLQQCILKENTLLGLMIIEKPTSFYYRMKKSELGTFSVGSNKNYVETLRSKYVQSDHAE